MARLLGSSRALFVVEQGRNRSPPTPWNRSRTHDVHKNMNRFLTILTILTIGCAVGGKEFDGDLTFDTGDYGTGDGHGTDEGDGDGPLLPPDDSHTDDGRLDIVAVSNGLGLWDGTSMWSAVYDVSLLDGMEKIASDLWPCDPNPDVDICVEVDGAGHVGCFWIEHDFDVIVAIAPSCAIGGDGWTDVGNGMMARTE